MGLSDLLMVLDLFELRFDDVKEVRVLMDYSDVV
jgi:hypothetical protein